MGDRRYHSFCWRWAYRFGNNWQDDETPAYNTKGIGSETSAAALPENRSPRAAATNHISE